MNYLLAAENTLKNHHYNCVLSDANCELWYCEKEGSRDYRFFIVIFSTNIIVGGDIGTVVFCVGNDYGMSFLAKKVNDYYLEKLDYLHDSERELNKNHLEDIIAEYVILFLEENDDCKDYKISNHTFDDLKTFIKNYNTYQPWNTNVYDFMCSIKECESIDEAYELMASGPLEIDTCDYDISKPTESLMFRLHLISHAAKEILKLSNNKK